MGNSGNQTQIVTDLEFQHFPSIGVWLTELKIVGFGLRYSSSLIAASTPRATSPRSSAGEGGREGGRERGEREREFFH